MKILEVSSKSRVVKILIESEEDLWTLKTLLKPGDFIEARTTRDVAGALGGEKERRSIIVKLRVEKLEFQPFTGKLRASGVIVEGPEEYGVKGRHHSVTLTLGMSVTLEREGGWSVKALEALEKSGPKGRVIIAAVDYEEFALGILSPYGFKVILESPSRLPSKEDPRRDEALEDYILKVAELIVGEASKANATVAVVVGPGFLKDYVAEKVKALDGKLKVIVDSASTGGSPGLEEALRRHSLIEALKEFSIMEAEAALSEFMSLIVKDPERVAYGVDDVEATAALGALRDLVVLDSLLSAYEEKLRLSINSIMENAERVKAKIIIAPEESPVGDRIRSLGGVIAILRYPVPRESRQLLKS